MNAPPRPGGSASLQDSATAVFIHRLSHRYGSNDRPALDDVSLTVGRGERIGLLGPNGAGKTTLMRVLAGFLPVQRGVETRVRVGGHDLCSSSRRGGPQVGYLPEHVPLYSELRVVEHLDFRARLKGLGGRMRRQEITRVAELTALADVMKVPIFELSRGFRQRVGIADALLGRPPLLMLDEPTVGLDPNQILDIRRTLRAIEDDQTLVFSTHILGEVEMLCERVVVLDRGRVVADEGIAEALRSPVLVVEWERGDEVELRKLLQKVFEVCGLDPSLGLDFEATIPYPRARVDCQHAKVGSDAVLAAIGRESAARGLALRRLEAERPRLEKHFARVTGAARRKDAEA